MTKIYNTDNILSNFPSCLRANIEELCLRSKIGLSSVSVHDITNMPNPHISNIFNNYHFIIKVPYAGKRLKWEIIFDPEDFDFAPDFDFNDDQFLSNPDLETINANIPTLQNWNLKNPKALTLILNEFLTLYKKHQVEKLQLENIFSQYREQYEALITEEIGVKPENVEVCIEGNNIHFLISIIVDCSSLPEYVQPNLFRETDPNNWYNPGEDFVHLKISILKLDGTRSNVSIQLSSRLEQVLASSRGFNLPEFKKDCSLGEYVSLVSKLFENRIAMIADHFRIKKIYIMALAVNCSRSMVEYDTETFNKAVFIYSIKDYDCLVTVTIGPRFPQEKPSVLLSSLYCQDGKTCNENLEKYPYYPNANPEFNIEPLLEYLRDAVLRFKKHRHY